MFSEGWIGTKSILKYKSAVQGKRDGRKVEIAKVGITFGDGKTINQICSTDVVASLRIDPSTLKRC